MAEHDLWVTDRCAREDLGLDTWPDPEGVLGVRDETVRKFRERRGEAPESGTYNNDLSRELRKPCYELKDERLRGLTWFDREALTAFLIFVGYHEQGSRDDAYEVVLKLARSRGVLPTDDDYAALAQWRAGTYLRLLRDEVGPALRRDAMAEPGVPIEKDIGQCNVVLVADRYDDGWYIQLLLDPIDREPIGSRQAAEIALRIIGSDALVDEGTGWYGAPISWRSRVFHALISAGMSARPS